MKYVLFIVLMLCSTSILATEATVTSVECMQPKVFTATSATSKKDISYLAHNNADKKYVFLFVKIKLDWAEADKEYKFTFKDVNLVNDSEIIAPIGSATMDGRLSSVSRPEREDYTARKQWENNEIRFGAVFLVDPKESLKFKILDKEHDVKVKVVDKMPDQFFANTIVEHKLMDEYKFKAAVLRRAKVKNDIILKPAAGKILYIKVKSSPKQPNVKGADLRSIIKPGDFYLKSGEQIITLRGIAGSSSLIEGTIYNVSRKKMDEFTKASAEMKLLFFVGGKEKSWQLYYGDTLVGEIENK